MYEMVMGQPGGDMWLEGIEVHGEWSEHISYLHRLIGRTKHSKGAVGSKGKRRGRRGKKGKAGETALATCQDVHCSTSYSSVPPTQQVISSDVV